MKKLIWILCLFPSMLFAQQDRTIEKIVLTGFGYHSPDPDAEKWIGKPMPAYQLKTPEGKEFTPESLKGKVVVMDFWASWCGWCKRMTADIDTVLTRYPKSCVQLIGVGYKEINQEKGLKYWKDSKFKFPMTLNNPQPGTALRAGHPSVCVVDKNGIIRGYTVGYSEEKIKELDLLVSYLTGQLDISAEGARKALARKEYAKATGIIDLLIADHPDMEKSLWEMRLQGLRGMKNPNVAKYMDYLKVKYAGDQTVMPAIGAVKYTQPLVISNVNVVDVIGGKILPGQDILITDGLISQISPMAGWGMTCQKIEGKGAYVIPGLIDAHVHFANAFKNDVNGIYPHLDYFLNHGITSVRDAGGDASVLGQLKSDITDGKIKGPNLYYSSFMAGPAYFNRSGGKADPSQFNAWNQCLTTGDDLDAAMKAAVNCGATGVKLYAGFDQEFLTKIVSAAKRHGLKTWAHAATFPAKPHEVADAGAEVLSHTYLLQWENVAEPLTGGILEVHMKYQKGIDRNNVNVMAFCESMKKHHAIFDPTICVSYAGEGDWILETLKKVYQQGVKICAGTDMVNILSRPYPFLFDELDYYVKRCGFSNIDALRTASINAAETVGAEKKTGSVDIGKSADLLILGSDPLKDISALKDQLHIIKGGVLIK